MEAFTALVFSVFITAFVKYIFDRLVNSNKDLFQMNKDRLIKAYHPMFNFIEPVLYKEISTEEAKVILEKLKSILITEGLYVDTYVKISVKDLEEKIAADKYSYKDFERVCYAVESEYEKLKKKVYLPPRDKWYRYNQKEMTKQEYQTHTETLQKIRTAVLYTVLLLFSIAVFYFVLAIFKAISSI